MKALLFILIILAYLKETLSITCPSNKPYEYNGVCYAECPWSPPDVTYLDSVNSVCVQICPGPLYFADDSTKSCTLVCPSYPIMTFYDHQRQKCVQRCPSTPSLFSYQTNRSCLTDCPNPLFADDSTRSCVASCPTGMFYQIDGLLRICTEKCYPNFYANISGYCVIATDCPRTPVKYYGDDLSGKCVKSCPQNSDTYAQQSSRKCVHHCQLGMYADPTTLRCVSQCPQLPLYYGSNITRMCHLKCNEGQFAYMLDRKCYEVCPSGYGDYSTRKCVQKCPQSQNTFADPQIKLCISVCSPGYFADNQSRTCVQSVDCANDLVGNPLTLQCIEGQNCPVGYFIDYNLFLCVKRCSDGQFANLDSRVCGTTCPWNPPLNITFKQSDSRKCVLKCPSNPRSFSDNITQSCVEVCPDPYFGTPTNYDCVETCPDGFYGDTDTNLCVSTCTTNTSVILYFFNKNTSCLSSCPEGTFKDNTTFTCVQDCPNPLFANDDTNECVQFCPDGTYGDKHSKSCVLRCPAITKQYADDSTNLCVDICPLDPDYFGEDLHDGNRKCVSQCTLTDSFADPITRTCQKQCNTSAGYFGYSSTRKCVLKCPVGFGNPLTKLCTSICPQSPIQLYGDNLTSNCVTKCPNNTYGDKTIQICVNATDCPSNKYGDDSTNMCVSKCPVLINTFGDPVTKKCVKSCQFSYYSDNTTRLCTQTCNTTAQLYKDPSTLRCVLNCPSLPALYNDPAVKMCVPHCTGALFPYKYSYRSIRKCVSMCPSSPSYFADQQTKTCVLKCANGTFRFTNNTYRGCLSHCPLQIFNSTQNMTLYQDNTTWTCVSVCPNGYYAFRHPTDNNIRKCVKMCQIVTGVYYFADDVSRSCVTVCPTKVQNTWGDRLTFKCVKTCSRKQYRDITTKQCVYSCPKSPVQYFADNSTWNCSKKCPVGTFAQSINNTCAIQCPTNYFGYQQKCLDKCPTGTIVYEDNTTWLCVSKCSELPDYYSDSQNQKCVKNCTPGTFADPITRNCVSALQCSGITAADPITHRCVDQCSKVPMYYLMKSTNLCGSVCFDNLFAFNDTNQCIQACPDPYFGVNSSFNFYCTQYCPLNELKYIDPVTLFRICLSECPEGFYAYIPNMECLSRCPDGYYGNEANNLCVQSCSPLYADETTNMCVDICSTGLTTDNNTYTCKGKCQYGQYNENSVCVTTCSDGLYADNLTRSCLSECPQDPFTFADPLVKKCVFQCSPGYFGYFDNRTCLQSCPEELFAETTLRICLNPCLEGQYGDPQTFQCVTSCAASTYSFADPTSKQCVQICPETPDLYGLNNKCIDQCPEGKYAQNFTRTCVDICPNISATVTNQSFADDLTRRCVQKCSALSYSYQNETHNVCLNQCPSGFFASQLLKACVSQCPSPTFANNNTNQCISRCPSGSWGDTLTRICTDGCYNNQFSDNSTNLCVDRCPQDPDLYGQTLTSSCVLTCQTDFYAHPIERMCVSECQQPYYADPSSRLCVLICPTHQFSYADDEIRQCVTRCSNYSGVIYYADKTKKKCVSQCPSSPQLLYGVNSTNTCDDFCPSNTFGDNDTRLCLDKCVFQDPKFNWMDSVDNMCVNLCPLGYFADNYTKSCQQSCFTGTYADNSTRRCVFSCPVAPSSFATLNDLGKPVCFYTCKSGLFADEITRSCVFLCPKEPFYYFHANSTNSCQKQCVYPYFGEIQSQYCVIQCKDGFYGNLTTKKCQACRTQCVTCSAYLECLTCQIGFYLYEFECVTACPTYPILYFSLQSSARCFRKCPSPYFGLQSTKKCQLGCPVSFYPNNLTRLCTPCPTGCLSCESLGCISCYQGYTFVNSTKTCNRYCNSTHIYFFNDLCYNNCPDGSFLTNDLVTCESCATQCATCSISAGNCTRCAQKFFYQGKCVDACPTDFFVNEELACIACSVSPQRCILQPLTYKITPFTQNYMQKAYVTFSRPVSMSLQEFNKLVQIIFNGKALKSNEFTAKVHNITTFVITISQTVTVNQQSLKIQYKPSNLDLNSRTLQQKQLLSSGKDTGSISLNENTITIGFKPGTVTDPQGNILTINKLEQKFEQKTVVTPDVIQTTEKVQSSAQIISWVLLAVTILLLIKSSYPVLLFIEIAQIIYIHIFLYATPMPFLQLKFLETLKDFHFTLFPQIFSAGLIQKQYQPFTNDMSLLSNSSPLIFIWVIVGLVYLVFTILSNKKFIKNKHVRKFAKRVKKYRLRFSIIHEAFWLTFIYVMFFAAYQFKMASFSTSTLIGNFIFSVLIFILYLAFTIYMVKLGNKYKQTKRQDIPRKYSFIVSEQSSFPMQIPFRYIRKLMLCLALVMPYFEAQVIIMMMTNFVFMSYYMCFTPSSSKLTSYLNFSVEVGYLLIEGLFFAYYKLQTKNTESQNGFSIALICIETIILFSSFFWLLYKYLNAFKSSQIWKYIYLKLTQNTDPQYLREQQRKRDLQFDFGSVENRSQFDVISKDQISLKSLNFKKDVSRNKQKQVDFDKSSEQQIKIKKKQKKQKDRKISTQSQLSLTQNDQVSFANNKSDVKQIVRSQSSKVQLLETKKTRIKSPFIEKRNVFLKIDSQYQNQIEEIQVNKRQNDAIQKVKKQQYKGAWDDLQFDENEI